MMLDLGDVMRDHIPSMKSGRIGNEGSDGDAIFFLEK